MVKSLRYVDEYFELMEKKPENFCKEQLQLRKWLPEKLKGAVLDNEKAEGMTEFIEEYFFPLMPFQKFLNAMIVGVYDEDGVPLFDEFLQYGGRGLGKNGYASGVAAYLLSNRHGVGGYDIDIIANSEDQAKTSFNDVYEVIKANSILKNAFRYNKTEISFKGTASTLKYRTSSAKSADGGRPGALIFDEIHAYESEEALQTHKSGLGKKTNPRIFYLTTDGYVREGYLDKLKERAKGILFDGAEDFGLFPMIFKLDDSKEAKDPEKWVKANPRIEHSPTLKRQVMKDYQSGLEDETTMVEFMTKRMNLPVEDRHRSVTSWENILRASEELPDLRGWPCIGAIDYAGIRDFCSVGLLFRDKDKAFLMQHTFIHESSIKNTRFNIPIKEAVGRGLATIVREEDYGSIPTSMVLDWFLEKAEEYSIQKIVADRFRITWLKDTFNDAGIGLEEVGSGYITHNKLHPLISKLFSDGLIKWGDDMLMRWYTHNTMAEIDKKGNYSYKKIEPIKRKTDGFFMLVHALTQWEELYEPVEHISLTIL